MVEVGARPRISRTARQALAAAKALTTPLVPDDYLELLNPKWSWRELKGRVVAVQAETPDTRTIVIEPASRWPGHVAGQYVRIGIELNGIRHWRNYTLTSDPGHPEGLISVTVKRVEEGKVSPWFSGACIEGDAVYLGEAEGTFLLPERTGPSLMLTAGSGITPIWSLLRAMSARGVLNDVVHIHGCHDREDFIFAEPLHHLAAANPGYTLIPWYRADRDRIGPDDLAEACPDWADREAFLSGPASMIDTFLAHWRAEGDSDRLHYERFQPVLGEEAALHAGTGGSIRFRITERAAVSDGKTSILEAGEQAGGDLPHGCRMGVCHTCKCRLVSGRVRDLRSGEVYGEPGEMVRTCVTAPEGPIELDEGHVVFRGTNARSAR